MNKLTIVYTIILMSIFVACKNEKSTDDLEVKNTEVEHKGFKISFEITSEKDDEFHLFYTEDGSMNFNGDNLVIVSKDGSNSPQTVEFLLPEQASPLNIRLDLGDNTEQASISFSKMTLEYKGKKFEATGSNIFNYFFPNGFIEYDTFNGVVILKTIEGQHYDPMLIGNEEFLKEIEKLY